jgi:5-(carboxyamino)imidazole ribonucleotide synthase
MPDTQPSGPLPPGSTIASWAAASSAACWRWPAARLGLKTHIYCEESGPAFDVATHTTKGAFDDHAALDAFARTVDAVTYEFENVPIAAAERLSAQIAVRPGAKALAVSQDRLTEKQFIAGSASRLRRSAIGEARAVGSALSPLRGPAILKTRRLGYDGKGQASVAAGEMQPRLERDRRAPAVLEKRIAFALRDFRPGRARRRGELAFYDCPRNTHEGGILRRSVVPAALPQPTSPRAATSPRPSPTRSTTSACWPSRCSISGPTRRVGSLMVNEIAPRVHNSGHWTIEACGISQFENHMRAVAGWPLGSTERHSDAEMVNLIGKQALDWPRLAAEPGACLHLYGKREARRAARWATSRGCSRKRPVGPDNRPPRTAEIDRDLDAPCSGE